MIVSVRRAQPADIEPIGRFGAKSWFAGIAPHVSQARRERDIEALFRAFAREFLPEILVAEEDGMPVGFVATEHGDNFISDLWVAPSHFGQGIGSRLLAAQEALIAARDYKTARISALSANVRALRLYRVRGYVDTETVESLDEALGEVLLKTRLEKRLQAKS